MLTAVGFWAPKAGNRVDEWEDSFALDETSGRFAVADGASSSSQAAAWAAELTTGFLDDVFSVAEPDAFASWLDRRAGRFAEAHPATDRAEMTAENWYAVAASEADGYATFIGASVLRATDGSLMVQTVGVGDSVAAVVRDGHLVHLAPTIGADGFDSYPDLLPSDLDRLATAAEAAFRSEFGLEAGDELLLMSDAIAEWALNHAGDEPEVWDVFGELDSHTFTSLVTELRAFDEIVNDDVTLVRCRVT